MIYLEIQPANGLQFGGLGRDKMIYSWTVVEDGN